MNNNETTRLTVRRMTELESERLMGFEDNWTKIPYKGKPADKCPSSHRYKACGNSMCVNVMRWIGRRIDAVDGIMKQKQQATGEAPKATNTKQGAEIGVES